MAVLTLQALTDSGLDPTLAAASAGGDEFENDGNIFVIINNAAGVTRQVTFSSQRSCSQGFDHDAQVDVDAGTEVLIGPFGKHRFNDSAGHVQMSYDDETSVSVAAVRMSDAPTG